MGNFAPAARVDTRHILGPDAPTEAKLGRHGEDR
jgi:hypothetical protein